MAKHQVSSEDEDLLLELGEDLSLAETPSRTAREERIIAGFEDIERFVQQHGRLPQHGEDRDIFERLYAVRLEAMRASTECRAVLEACDRLGLLQSTFATSDTPDEPVDDEALLAELGLTADDDDFTNLTHVKPRAEIRAAEEIAQRAPCHDFDAFKPLFEGIAKDISNGTRITRSIRKEAGFLKSKIKVGEFFILFGQTIYIAEMGEPIKGSNEAMDARLRVIYSNGTESNLLLDSLRRALYKDESSRIISEPSMGPLFSDACEDGAMESGTIYVLRSLSDHPFVQEHRNVIHKIGVTGGDIQRRIAGARLDPTFLMADVEIVATYQLSNINRVKLENLIHRFFETAKLEIAITDRFGRPVVPREWFIAPLSVIDEAVGKIRDGSIVDSFYDATAGKIAERDAD
jgi:hypothetical protein